MRLRNSRCRVGDELRSSTSHSELHCHQGGHQPPFSVPSGTFPVPSSHQGASYVGLAVGPCAAVRACDPPKEGAMFRRLHLTTSRPAGRGASGCGDRADPGPTDPRSDHPGTRASRARHGSGRPRGPGITSRTGAARPPAGAGARGSRIPRLRQGRARPSPGARAQAPLSHSSAAPAAVPGRTRQGRRRSGVVRRHRRRARLSRSRCTCPSPPIARPGAAARISWWPPRGTTTRLPWPTTRGAGGGCSTRARRRPRRCWPSSRWRPT